ncbi:HAD-IA family hydrolase [Pseudomonas sp. OIL-1]|uniref:HAD-IA family hydrolase n=1 Tax=Pseudomonas sp. OIL-1 TaxID=2706126 RepID=UPI0013A73B8D|nr:HAD-IA family hydrolase [Pseudomonas sp. OIL-1]QIB52426.1 HAD-IA family hydrolase [Pseudomonas sp. OIL-1]
MNEFNTLIFDWDGTLVDSVEKIVEAMQVAADEVGLLVPAAGAVRGIIGLGLPEAIATLYPELDDPSRAAALKQAYSDCYIRLELTPSPMFEGVMNTLDACRKQGFNLAVATGKSRRGLQRILAQHGLTDYFDATRCADETASKPHPLMLREILAQLDVAPEQALMVGDSEFDMHMARNAGMAGVAVSYGAQSREQLLCCDPVHCIDEFIEFHGWVMPRYGARQTIEV